MFFSPYKNPAKAALDYAERGIAVFPFTVLIHENEAKKKPLCRHGYKDATTDITTVRAWWDQWPNALIGVPAGSVNQLFVLDIDTEATKKAFFVFCAKLGFCPEETAWEKTPRGYHYIYAYPAEGRTPTGSNGDLFPGVETKGERCSFIISPSSYVMGSTRLCYQIGHDGMVCEMPEPLFRRVQTLHALEDETEDMRESELVISGNYTALLEELAESVRESCHGERHTTLLKKAVRAGHSVRCGYFSREEARDTLIQAGCACGLPRNEVVQTVLDGLGYGMRGRHGR